MKAFLAEAGVPTAAFGTFTSLEPALSFLDSMTPPYVVKTDGLAAGKGVLVTSDRSEAIADITEKLSGSAFGDAGRTVIIEEGLDGEECSLLVLCDGELAVPLVPAQDFKRVGDDDLGANTGGMGAYAPLALLTPALQETVMQAIVTPTLKTLRDRGIEYRGVLYAGVMLTSKGPKLLEYNVRFGDPETEVLAVLYGGALLDLLVGTATGTLSETPAPTEAAVTVVLAADGYPASPRKGDAISGLDATGQLAEPIDGVVVFHAGTACTADGVFRTAGGRVMAVTAKAPTLEKARELAYQGANAITFKGKVQRSDIARRAVEEAS
jgi:phosphoribosylamine--glycine ligase